MDIDRFMNISEHGDCNRNSSYPTVSIRGPCFSSVSMNVCMVFYILFSDIVCLYVYFFGTSDGSKGSTVFDIPIGYR